jgi:uncharacterized protein YoxC
MAELNELLVSILMILGSIVLLVLIAVLVRISNTLQRTQEEVKRLIDDVHPLIDKVTSVSEQTESLLKDVNAQKQHIENSVLRLRDISDSVYSNYSKINNELTPAVDSIVSIIGNIRRGFETFVSTWRASR